MRAGPWLTGCRPIAGLVAIACASALLSPTSSCGRRSRSSRPPAVAGTAAAPRPGSPPAGVGVQRRAQPPAVSRTALLQVLDRGPGAFLGTVEVTPHFRAGRFAGWRIVRLWPEHSRLAAADLRAGDVVTAVNGRPIARPEELHAVWTDLRRASAIVIRGLRGDVSFELRFPVRDDSAPGVPGTP